MTDRAVADSVPRNLTWADWLEVTRRRADTALRSPVERPRTPLPPATDDDGLQGRFSLTTGSGPGSWPEQVFGLAVIVAIFFGLASVGSVLALGPGFWSGALSAIMMVAFFVAAAAGTFMDEAASARLSK